LHKIGTYLPLELRQCRRRSFGKSFTESGVAFFDNTCETGMMNLLKNGLKEWRATVAVCQNGAKKRVLGVCVQLFACFLGCSG